MGEPALENTGAGTSGAAARTGKPAPNRWLGVLALLVIVLISYVDRVNVSVLITDKGFTDHFGIDRLPAHRVPLLFAAGGLGTGTCVAVVISADSVWLAATGLILANGFWGLQGPAIPTLVQHHTRGIAVGTAYGIVNGAGNLVSAFMPTAMGLAIALSGHGFAAGYGLLIGTQAVTVLCSLWMLLSTPSRCRRNHRLGERPGRPGLVGTV